MFALPNYAPADCRAVTIPACEPDTDAGQTAPILAAGTFQLRLRDVVDFSVDFSTWLAANGNPLLTAAVWTVAASSPKTPVLSGTAFSPNGKCVVVVAPGVGALAGDAYYLDVVATVGATTPGSSNDVSIPARTLTRRINVVVVNG